MKPIVEMKIATYTEDQINSVQKITGTCSEIKSTCDQIVKKLQNSGFDPEVTDFDEILSKVGTALNNLKELVP